MAQKNYAPLVGKAVSLTSTSGPFRACMCGSKTGIIGKGISTHPGHLKCSDCGKHISWIGAAHMDALLASMGEGTKRKKGVA